MTDEQKAKDAIAQTERFSRPEERAKASVAHMGHTASPEARAKMSASKKGKTGHSQSLETRAKLLAACKGKPLSAEHRAKLSAARKGRVTSAETRVKMSVAGRLRKVSPETRAKQSAAEMGPLNWNWNGGITPINLLIRNSAEYAAWRTAVFERDNYTCQECGERGGYLEAHHLHEFAKYPEERFVVDNGKTLCLECHNKTKPGRPRVAVTVCDALANSRVRSEHDRRKERRTRTVPTAIPHYETATEFEPS